MQCWDRIWVHIVSLGCDPRKHLLSKGWRKWGGEGRRLIRVCYWAGPHCGQPELIQLGSSGFQCRTGIEIIPLGKQRSWLFIYQFLVFPLVEGCLCVWTLWHFPAHWPSSSSYLLALMSRKVCPRGVEVCRQRTNSISQGANPNWYLSNSSMAISTYIKWLYQNVM